MRDDGVHDRRHVRVHVAVMLGLRGLHHNDVVWHLLDRRQFHRPPATMAGLHGLDLPDCCFQLVDVPLHHLDNPSHLVYVPLHHLEDLSCLAHVPLYHLFTVLDDVLVVLFEDVCRDDEELAQPVQC